MLQRSLDRPCPATHSFAPRAKVLGAIDAQSQGLDIGADIWQLLVYGGLSPLVECTIAERYTLFCQPLGLVHVHLELPHRGIAKVRGIAIARGLQWLGHNNNRLVGHDRNNKK